MKNDRRFQRALRKELLLVQLGAYRMGVRDNVQQVLAPLRQVQAATQVLRLSHRQTAVVALAAAALAGGRWKQFVAWGRRGVALWHLYRWWTASRKSA